METEYSDHIVDIDEYDFKRIIDKIEEIEKIISWIKQFKLTVTDEITKQDISNAIKHLRTKQKKLQRKAEKARRDFDDYADFLSQGAEDN